MRAEGEVFAVLKTNDRVLVYSTFNRLVFGNKHLKEFMIDIHKHPLETKWLNRLYGVTFKYFGEYKDYIDFLTRIQDRKSVV